MKALLLMMTLLTATTTSFALLFENTKKELVDTVDQNAQEFAKNFPAVCAIKTVLLDKDTQEPIGKALSTNGVLIYLERQHENVGYVLTSGRQFKHNPNRDGKGDSKDHILVTHLIFGADGSTSNAPHNNIVPTEKVNHLEHFTEDSEVCLSLIKFIPPAGFSIDPLPIYDGKGYLKGDLMDAIVVSYGVFKAGDRDPVKDFIRRAGTIKLKHTTEKKGAAVAENLIFHGLLRSGLGNTSLTPLSGWALTDHQIWPYAADEGAPVIVKTSRGYQVAGIYDALIIKPSLIGASHTWHFVPHYNRWIQDVIKGQIDPNKNCFGFTGPIPTEFDSSRAKAASAAKNGGTTHSSK